MDNLTHALVGILISHSLVKKPELRTAATWIGVLASNLPDIDLVMQPFFDDPKLGYLVHHRGYTHTIPVALGLLPLALGLGTRIGGLRWFGLEASARRQLLTVGVVGVLLHMGADAWNNYGVHPFWPVWPEWIYGDFIFILEPLLLAMMLPYALWTAKTRLGMAGWALPLLAVLGLVWAMPGLPLAAGIGTTLFIALMLGLQHRLRSVTVAISGVLAVLALFLTGSQMAEAHLKTHLQAIAPQERYVDTSLTPTPGLPVCWQFILQSRADNDSRVQERLGYLSLWPALLSADDCAFRLGNERSARLEPLTASTLPGMSWVGQVSLPVNSLKAYAQGDCRIESLLHFTRMPYWQEDSAGGLLMGDLRYDFEPGLGFSELMLTPHTAPGDCSPYSAAWTPRAVQDLQAKLKQP